MRAQLARQVQPFGLAAVAAHGRLFPGAGDGADEALQVPVPGQVFVAVFEGLDHAFQIVREFALARGVDVFFCELAQRLFIDVVTFVPEVVRLGRVVGDGDGFVGLAFRFGQVLLVRSEVEGGLDLVDVVFQAFKGLEEQGIVHIDPIEGRREGRQVVEIGVDDDIHGQVDGHLAVLAAQVLGSQEMEGDDVQDFVFDRAFHLLRREGQEEHGVEVEVIARALEVNARRRGHVEADFLDHLEEEVAEEVVLVFHELAVDAVQEGVELPLESCRDVRDLARRALFVEDDVGDDGCLLIEEMGRNGQRLFHRHLAQGPEGGEVAVDEVVVVQGAGIDPGVGGFHVLHDAEAQVDRIEGQEGDEAGNEGLGVAFVEADGVFQLLEDVLGSQVEPGVASEATRLARSGLRLSVPKTSS